MGFEFYIIFVNGLIFGLEVRKIKIFVKFCRFLILFLLFEFGGVFDKNVWVDSVVKKNIIVEGKWFIMMMYFIKN